MEESKLPAIAIGTWAWGSGYVGGRLIFGKTVFKSQLKKVYRKACESGFTLFDTAPVYGYGESEKRLGKFSKEDGNVLLATKFMPFPLQGKGAMQRSLTKSLQRLQRETVDIFWIHTPTNVEKWTREIIPIMQSQQVKYVGVSNHNLIQIQQAKAILEAAGLQLYAVQNHFSLLYLTCLDNGILSWCKEQGIHFFSYMVLEQGALTSHYNADNPFPKYSRRAKAFPPTTLKRISPLLDRMKELAIQKQVEVADIAIAHALYHGTIPIVGITKEKQIDGLLRAISITLSKTDIQLLESQAKLTNVKRKGFWENRM